MDGPGKGAAGGEPVNVLQLMLSAVATLLVVSAVVTLLKGTLYLVGDLFRNLMLHAGEPWTVGAFIEPFLSVPTVFVLAAVGLGRPESPWARWFYGPGRMEAARLRHHEAIREVP